MKCLMNIAGNVEIHKPPAPYVQNAKKKFRKYAIRVVKKQ